LLRFLDYVESNFQTREKFPKFLEILADIVEISQDIFTLFSKAWKKKKILFKSQSKHKQEKYVSTGRKILKIL